MASVRFVNNTQKVLNEYRVKARTGVYRMGQDVLRKAGNRTPKKRGVLRRLTSVRQLSDTRSQVKWSARYAAVQNLGHRAGARRFRKYTTPGTGSGFVETGIEYVRKNYKEYFR